VPTFPYGKIAVIISLGPGLLRASCGLPEGHGRASRWGAAPVSRSSCPPIWPCSRWRLPASHVATAAVGSYPAISPLPDPTPLRTPAIGGMLSVAPVSDRSAWALPSTLPMESGLSSSLSRDRRPPARLPHASPL